MLDFYIVINSTTTDAMYTRDSGNEKRDKKVTWNYMNSNIQALLISPSDFYIIGIGFIHIWNGFGHQSTRDLIENKYGINIPVNRTSLKMECGIIFVPQYMGKRLEEGATELPEGAKLTPKVNFINCKITSDKVNFIPFNFADEYNGFWDIFDYIKYLEGHIKYLEYIMY